MAPRASDSPSSPHNHQQKRIMFMNSMRTAAANNTPHHHHAMSPSTLHENVGVHGPTPLIDRLAFVLVVVGTGTNSSNSPTSNGHMDNRQVWWPAWVFENASEMFHELSLTPEHRAALMQEFFLVGRQQPTKSRQHVAYLIGTTIPGPRRTIYGSQTRDFWTISDEVVSKCSEYPGWCDACLEAPELSNCNTAMEGTTIIATNNNNTTTTATMSPTATSSPHRSSSTISNHIPHHNSSVYDYDESSTVAAAGVVKYRRRRNNNY